MAVTRRTINEQLELGAGFRRAYTASLFVGGVGLAGAILVGYFSDPSFRRFYFAYLISFAFFLSISLGAIFFVLLQHLTRAGWSVGVRRIAETLAAAIPVLAALSAPIVLSVIMNRGDLYRWAQPVGAHVEHVEDAGYHAEPEDASPQAHAQVKPLDELTLKKRAYLNPGFFLVRLAIYFVVWSAIGVWYWRRSVDQDESGDVEVTHRMQGLSAPAMVVFAITFTFASFDLLMSLDPAWFSTIFGIYYFSGAAVAIFATLILVLRLLQSAGCLSQTITTEHYHDLGKFLFGFTFFWGYIAFSQYMLLWYANMPETSGWFVRRGATTVDSETSVWSVVVLILLLGHLIVPFAGLLSRHVKRSHSLAAFWAAWMLIFHWLDLYWLVMPEFDGHVHLGIVELACLLGIGGIYVATLLRLALRHNLRPVRDPRLSESLAFQNI